MTWLRKFRWFLTEVFVPLRWRFTCTECRDVGMVSYDDRVGSKTYHVWDYCRKCRPRGADRARKETET